MSRPKLLKLGKAQSNIIITHHWIQMCKLFDINDCYILLLPTNILISYL